MNTENMLKTNPKAAVSLLTRTDDNEVNSNYPTDDYTPDLSEVSSSSLFSELWKRFKMRITGSRKTPSPSKPFPTIHEPPPPQVQVIHKCIIREKPKGLIGERVVYNENSLRKLRFIYPMPECGYFIITKAVLQDDCSVRVALHPHRTNTDDDGTHINLSDLKKYSTWDNTGKTKIDDFLEIMKPHIGSKLNYRLYELRSSYGIRYLEDVREDLLIFTRGIGKATYQEFLRSKERYNEMTGKISKNEQP